MFQCVRASRPPFLRSDTEWAVLGKPWRNAKRMYEIRFIGGTESKCLNERFKPRSGFAGNTGCWAPIVIRLGCLLFCFVWILFLDFTNVFSNQTKSSLGQGENVGSKTVLFLPRPPIPSHPIFFLNAPPPPQWKVKMVAVWGCFPSCYSV